MATTSPHVNLNLKFSESFLIRLGCMVVGHKFRGEYLPAGPALADGRQPIIEEYICLRCGKFRDHPFDWKEYRRHPVYFRVVR